MTRGIVPLASAIAIALLPASALAKSNDNQAPSVRGDSLSNITTSPRRIREALDDALMSNPNSVRLNFLSGLVYDAQSTPGSEGRQLARVGYLTALRADPTFWPANYQLGLLAMEDGDALSAQQYFVGAAFHAPDVAIVFQALARAAYCAGDMASAVLAEEHAIALAAPGREDDYTTAALVAAANGDREGAGRWIDQLTRLTGRPPSRELAGRVSELLKPPPAGSGLQNDVPGIAIGRQATSKPATVASSASARRGLATVTAPHGEKAATPNAATPPPTESSPPPEPPTTAGRRKMATVDVVIIRRKEGRASTTGVNLMDALTLQFGSTLINAERSRTVDRLAGATTSDVATSLSNANLTIPTVTYSLNIANASGNQSSIDARPTLLIYDGQTSKVFSGGTLTYAASGQLSSQSYTKEVGLSLNVTPKFNDDNTITLSIDTALETFVDTPTAGTFQEALQTEKTSTEIKADLRYGDTVIVFAGRYSNYQVGKSRTPILSDIPLVKNLFRARSNSHETDDVLVLLSLRREVGGAETGSLEEAERAKVLSDRLWRKLGLEPTDTAVAREAEKHRSFYTLDNLGRGFNKAYMEQVGVSDLFVK